MRLAPNCIAVTTSASQQQETAGLCEIVPRMQEAAAAAAESEEEEGHKEEVQYGKGQAHAGEKKRKTSGVFHICIKVG